MIELLEMTLRDGSEAPRAAGRAARSAARYLSSDGVDELAIVVAECIHWLAPGNASATPHPLRLELSASSAVVRVTVTDPGGRDAGTAVFGHVRQGGLSATAVLASRWGVEKNHRTRVWAEFDRPPLAVA